MRRYATNTVVAVEATQQEIVQLLKRYKASAYGFATDGRMAKVQFKLDATGIMFLLEVPDAEDACFAKDAKGRHIPTDKRPRLADQEERRLWRSLLLVIKAKLESVQSGIETMEEAFLAQTILPNGTTMAQFHREALKPMIAAGKMPSIAGAIPDRVTAD